MQGTLQYIKENIVFVSIVTIIVIGFIALIVVQRTTNPSPRNVDIQGASTYSITDRKHVQDSVEYAQTPPAGGNHNSVWSGCNGQVYDTPLTNENAVHSLEHGAVWLTYKPGLDKTAIDTLAQKVNGVNYTFMSPYPGLTSPIVLTAWNNQLAVSSADDPRIDQFIDKFRSGRQTPEPGASCVAPSGAGM